MVEEGEEGEDGEGAAAAAEAKPSAEEAPAAAEVAPELLQAMGEDDLMVDVTRGIKGEVRLGQRRQGGALVRRADPLSRL